MYPSSSSTPSMLNPWNWFSSDPAELHQSLVIEETDITSSQEPIDPTGEKLKAADEASAEFLKRRKQQREATIFGRCTRGDIDPLAEDPSAPVDVIVGIVDGELRYFIEEDPKTWRATPFSAVQTAATIAGFAAASYASYAFLGQGIITRTMISGFAGVAMPPLREIPYALRIGAAVTAAVAGYYLDNWFQFQWFKVALPVGALAATEVKKWGKFFGAGTLGSPFGDFFSRLPYTPAFLSAVTPAAPEGSSSSSNNTPLTVEDLILTPEDLEAQLPKENSEGEKSFNVFLEVQPHHTSPVVSTNPIKVKLELKNGRLCGTLAVGEKSLREYTLGDAVEDDDDDDDDEEGVKSKGKDKEASAWLKAGIMGASGVGTLLSANFLGQGITTEAFNTIFSACLKAQLRLEPVVNSYTYLGALHLTIATIGWVFPFTSFGKLSFVAPTVALNMAKKQIKDIASGKPPKDERGYKIPDRVRRIAVDYLGYKPNTEMPAIPFSEPTIKNQTKLIDVPMKVRDFYKGEHLNDIGDIELTLAMAVQGRTIAGSYLIAQEDHDTLCATLELGEGKTKKPKKKEKKADKAAKPEKTEKVKKKKKDKKGKKKSREDGKVEINKDLRAALGLAKIKPERPGAWREVAFTAGSVVATVASSYLTQEVSLSDITDVAHIQAEKSGEGVLTSIFASVLSSYAQQAGKNFPLYPTELATLGIAGGSLVSEQLLMNSGVLPFR